MNPLMEAIEDLPVEALVDSLAVKHKPMMDEPILIEKHDQHDLDF